PIYTIVANIGYALDSLIINGIKVTNTNNYQFDSLKSNQTIRVTFRIVQTLPRYTITTSVLNGQITPTQQVDSGSTIRITYSPANANFIDSVIINYSVVSDSNRSYTFRNVSSNQTIFIKFIPVYYISISNNIGGTINGISSSNRTDTVVGTYYYNYTTYNITTQLGYKIDSVFVDGLNQGAINSYTFNNINSNKSLRVVFKQIPIYTITTNAVNGQISQSMQVDSGSSFTVAFSPNSKFRIDSFFVNGRLINNFNGNYYTFRNISGDSNIRVVYKVYYDVSTFISNGQIGASSQVDSNSSRTINYTCNRGYKIDSIAINGIVKFRYLQNKPNYGSYTFNNIRGDSSISVYTSILRYTVTTNINTGQITPTQLVDSGSNFSVYFGLNQGYKVDSIIINGIFIFRRSQNNFYINADYNFYNVRGDSSIQVFVSLISYNITTNVFNGTISPPLVVDTNSRTTIRITYSPINANFFFDSVRITKTFYYFCCGYTTRTNLTLIHDSTEGYTLTNISSDINITAYYNRFYYIDVRSNIGGSINGISIPNRTDTIPGGNNKTYQITTLLGYKIDSVFADSVYQGAINSYTFNNISSNKSFRVRFKQISIYSINTNAINGSITPSQQVDSGSTFTVDFSPNTKFRIDSVFVNGRLINNYNNNFYTFRNISGDSSIRVVYKAYLNLSTYISNGVIDASSQVDSNSSKTVNYSCNRGYRIDSISINGIVRFWYFQNKPNYGNYTFTNIRGDSSIYVYTSKIRYTITTIINFGQITQTQQVDSGISINIFYNSWPYWIDSISLNNKVISRYPYGSYNSGNYQFRNISADSTIQIFTSKRGPTITTNVTNGQITPTQQVDSGTSIRVTYSSVNANYVIDSVFVNNIY
ncbi:MAG: hypothetical protein ORN85_10370, partial [Sediminibacterium sp.]|nr:hypothetical protein [Sediminibacterium sp.]